MRLASTLLLIACSAGCTDRAGEASVAQQAPAQQDWQTWHANKRDVERAMDAAIDAPGGGDWARAVQIMRDSDWPPAVKDHQIGMMVINSYRQPVARRPKETLEQGLELLESAAQQPGETRGYTPQHLRIIFERGGGRAPDNIPVDPVVAQCWRGLEGGGAGDPARCVQLRRERLPHVGR